jgi:hypothetical protein
LATTVSHRFSPGRAELSHQNRSTLRYRRAARAADVQPLAVLKNSSTLRQAQDMQSSGRTGSSKASLKGQKQANFGENNNHNPHTASASSYKNNSNFKLKPGGTVRR